MNLREQMPSGSRGRRLGPDSAIPAIVKLIRAMFFSVSMEIDVRVMEKELKINMDENATGEDLLKALKLLPDTVLIISGNRPIPYTEKLKEGDKIRIIRVASGG